jgi:hypothetical protein
MSDTHPDHWQNFYDFCRLDKAAGGPDPHMACIGRISDTRCLDRRGTAWLGVLYASVYNVPTALVLSKQFPTPESALSYTDVEAWLLDNWGGIAFRRERKAVRSVEKLAKCISSAAAYVDVLTGHIEAWHSVADEAQRYEKAFEDVCGGIYGFGRYIGQKWIEYLRRYCGVDVQVGDIRSKDGWSPRHALALLYPEHKELLEDGGDGPDAVAKVEQIATEARETLSGVFGLTLDYYELQVLLCDYKQCWVGKRQYPGRSQDSELDYDRKLQAYWGHPQAEMYEARKSFAPKWALGELNGWDGVRKPLGEVLRVHGYMWTDSKYNWNKSKNNLSQPTKS